MHPATPSDILAIYSLLHDAKFANLPPFSFAKPILENAENLILKHDGRVMVWACYHHKDGDIYLDLVIAPDIPRRLISKGVCKHLLAHGLNLSHNDRIVIEAYNPKGIKAAVTVGFHIDEQADREGWTRLVLTREMFERKFRMRG